MTEYVTKQGDTWDAIAKRLYGDERFLDVLIRANINHRKTVVFSYGKRLVVPEINTQSAAYELNLPLWKRRH